MRQIWLPVAFITSVACKKEIIWKMSQAGLKPRSSVGQSCGTVLSFAVPPVRPNILLTNLENVNNWFIRCHEVGAYPLIVFCCDTVLYTLTKEPNNFWYTDILPATPWDTRIRHTKPFTYTQHSKTQTHTSSQHILCPSQGQGAVVAAPGPMGPCGQASIWGNLSKRGVRPPCVGALCWLFQQTCFPKARKKYTKRDALSHGSVHWAISL